MIAQEDYHRVVQDPVLFQKFESLQHASVYRRNTVHIVVADGVRPEEAKVRHADKRLGEVHRVVEDPIKAQLGTGAVFHVESVNSESKILLIISETSTHLPGIGRQSIKSTYLFFTLRSLSLASMYGLR